MRHIVIVVVVVFDVVVVVAVGVIFSAYKVSKNIPCVLDVIRVLVSIIIIRTGWMLISNRAFFFLLRGPK